MWINMNFTTLPVNNLQRKKFNFVLFSVWPIYLEIYFYAGVHVFMSIFCLSVSLSDCMSVCPSVYLSIWDILLIMYLVIYGEMQFCDGFFGKKNEECHNFKPTDIFPEIFGIKKSIVHT